MSNEEKTGGEKYENTPLDDLADSGVMPDETDEVSEESEESEEVEE